MDPRACTKWPVVSLSALMSIMVPDLCGGPCGASSLAVGRAVVLLEQVRQLVRTATQGKRQGESKGGREAMHYHKTGTQKGRA